MGRRWPRRRSRRADLTAILVIAALVAGGLVAGYSAMYSALYSPAAFVKNYLTLISNGHAADALQVPGVMVDGAVLEEAGISPRSSDALLRGSVLRPLGDVKVTSSVDRGGVHSVTVAYTVGGHPGTTTFRVDQEGWTGIVPSWRFEQTPLSAIELTVQGSTRFDVNDFIIDKRQILEGGVEADLTQPMQLLTFTPNLYVIDVETKTATSSGLSVLADVPLAHVPVTVAPEATPAFTAAVQESVNDFLTACATQTVLQPTGCPYGYVAPGRVTSEPTWEIVGMPAVQVALEGDQWVFPSAAGLARVNVDVQSFYDGTIEHVGQDVHFVIAGHITILADGRISIRIDGIDPV